MQQVLNQPPIEADKSFSVGSWHFLLLTYWIPKQVHNQLSQASLDWLEQQLQLIDKPTLVALHHPPCPINSDWMERIKLQNPDEFFAVIERYSQVKLVVFGYIHQAFEGERRGVQYLGSPSTCVQFKL